MEIPCAGWYFSPENKKEYTVMVKTLNFKCPECGDSRLEEVMSGVVVSSSISTISSEDGMIHLNYGPCSHEEGEVDNFQCMGCGWVLKWQDGTWITDGDDVGKWLTEN